MDILLAVIFGAVLGYFIASVVNRYREILAIRELDENISTTLKRIKDKIIPARIEEEEGGVLFLYNSETNEFLGQGVNFEELENAVKTKYPSKIFNVPQAEIDKHFKD